MMFVAVGQCLLVFVIFFNVSHIWDPKTEELRGWRPVRTRFYCKVTVIVWVACEAL